MRDQLAINEKIRQAQLKRVADGTHVPGRTFKKGKDPRRHSLTKKDRQKAVKVRNENFAEIPFDDLSKSSKRKSLIKELGNICQKCKNTEWNCLPIPLELEHIDGNNQNDSRENLTILCPNCHAQTATWRRKKTVMQLSSTG